MAGWDAGIINLADHSEHLAARNASYPQWLDEHRISFLRDRQVVVKDLRTEREEVVYDADRSRLSSGRQAPPGF